MSRRIRTCVAAACAVAALATAASASAAPKVVNGSVGPDTTIKLTLNGAKVTKLKAGVPYTFVINDRSSAHNFHLKGPGLDKKLTSVGFIGKKTYTLTLRKGTFTFVCDPHASFMHGSFKVS